MEGGKCGQKIRNNSLMLFHDDVYNLLEREEDGVRDREQKKKGKKQSKAKQSRRDFLFSFQLFAYCAPHSLFSGHYRRTGQKMKVGRVFPAI